nr:MAG TPA: hypothetical protein [Caudoviricetes sp.]
MALLEQQLTTRLGASDRAYTRACHACLRAYYIR